jgi:hypothetical protein
MSCNQTCVDCQCKRVNAVNIFSKDFRAGEHDGQKAEAKRTASALVELERVGVIDNAQMQAIFDLILEKLTDAVDID